VGRVGEQRLGLPLAFVRADPADPSPAAHERVLVARAVAAIGPADALVADAGFGVRHLQAAGATRYVVREARNVTARRAERPAYSGRGAPAKRGAVVRPLARTYRGRTIPTWQEGEAVVRAECWEGLVLPDGLPGDPTFRIVAIFDPRWAEPLLLASPLAIAPRALRDLYLDRWPVEQLPLAAKQLIGATRQFVSAPESCRRLPELALLAGSVLTYAAATRPPVPTGFWDRRPRPTAGRLRRALNRTDFPTDFPFPARIREKASRTDHLPKGSWGQHRRSPAKPAPPTTRDRATTPAQAA
jgi:hypothetical protein